jgi:phasin family protein
MTLFTDQLSAVRQSQWDAQLDIFRRLSTGALDSTEQLIALNMKTSRASIEQAAGTIKHFLDAKDPRDLFAVGSAAQGQWNQLFDYSRELLGIATGLRGTWSALPQAALSSPLSLIPAPTVNIPTTAAQVAEQAAIATADAVTLTSEIGAAAADIGSAMAEATLDAGVTALQAEPQADAAPPVQPEAAFDKAVDAALADVVPPVQAKPLAQAINEAAPLPASAVHPIASTVPLEAGGEVELPAVTPVERTPGGVQTRGPEQKAPRASRKK